jgi:perosamine synthetase
MIPLSAPHLRGDELDLVKQCIDTEWVSYAGGFVGEFEKNIAAVAGSAHATAMISGTAALHMALIISGVGPDDEVVMPPLTFVSPANAVRYTGAWPVFTDVSADTWQWDPGMLEDFLRNHCEREASSGSLRNKHTGRRIAALLPVHLLGGLADIDRIASLASEFDLPLIEDSAEAFGAKWKGCGIGSPLDGGGDARRIICTSFNGNKIITTGGGGALLCNDEETARIARHLSTTAKTDVIEFDHDQIGYNYRLSNLAAALGVAQLRQLDGFLRAKASIAARYDAELLDLPAVTGSLPARPEVTSSHWLYTIALDHDSRELISHLSSHGIQSRPLWKAMPDLRFLGACHVHSATVARDLVKRAISLPCSAGLSDEEQGQVISCVRGFLC